jgi:glycine betaine/proline transport system substrate-binding protein
VLVPDKDVVWLSVPSSDPVNGKNNSRLSDGRDTGFPIYEMKILVDKKFAAQNPAARKFFELVTIPAGDISAENLLMQKGENKITDIQRHAQNWIASHQPQFADWIRQSTAAGQA